IEDTRWRPDVSAETLPLLVVISVCADQVAESFVPIALLCKLLIGQLVEEVAAAMGRLVLPVEWFRLEPVVAAVVRGDAVDRPIPVTEMPPKPDALQTRCVSVRHLRSP